MTERFESLFDSVKERISNPLIFSFIFSWLIYNWRVTIALFWFDDDDLKSKGYTNLIDFIFCTLKSNNPWYVPNDVWFVPFGIALSYTFLMPLFKMLTEWFNGWILKKTNSRLFEITKDASISMKLYQDVKNKYEEEVKKLASEMNLAESRKSKIQELEANLSKEQTNSLNTINSLKIEGDRKQKLIDEAITKTDDLKTYSRSLEEKLGFIKQPIEGLWKVIYEGGMNDYYLFLSPKNYNNEAMAFKGQTLKRIKVVSTIFLEDHLIIVGFWEGDKQRLYFDVVKDSKGLWQGYLNSQSITMIAEGTKGF